MTAAHESFGFETLEDLRAKVEQLGLDLPLTDDVGILGTPVRFGALTVPNRLVVHPMEGCDGEPDGEPGELTLRRYERFASGGAGLIWAEACAVVPEGRANPRQLWITPANVDSFKQLVARIHAAERGVGSGFRPVLILQLTHSGRYSKPKGVPAPVIARHSIIDASSAVTVDTPVVTDDYLDWLQETYVQAALLAQEAGFDGVDVKACHGYLVSELLSSHTRANSRYGGNFENRTRFLREVVRKIREAAPALEVTCRLSLYDALKHPFGWGVDSHDESRLDLSEPLQLIGALVELGCHGISTTMGVPYYNPHLGRPCDRPAQNTDTTNEHPLEGIARLTLGAHIIQQTFPDLAVLGCGYSWLRQFFPNLAAALVEKGRVSLVGLGRGALAYPGFAEDILRSARMDAQKCCTTCSGCTVLMREGGPVGCVVRDADVYGPIYRRARKQRKRVNRDP